MNRRLLMLVFAALALPVTSHARLSPENGYGMTTLHAGDAGPAGDVIDLYNGSVWITEVDVFLPGIRGLDLSVVRSYSSQRARVDEWHELATGVPTDTTWLGRGWELTVGHAFIRPYTDLNGDDHFDGAITFDGVHGEEIRGEPLVPEPADLPYRSQTDLRIGITDAGTWVYVTDTGIAALRRGGRLVRFDHGVNGYAYPNSTLQTWAYYATRIENRFGDWIDIDYLYESNPGEPPDAIAGITDSLGRTVTFTTTGGQLESVTWPGPVSNLTQTYSVSSTNVSGVMHHRLSANGEPGCTPGLPTGLPLSQTVSVPTLNSVQGPDGLTHQFTYTVEEVFGHDSFPRARAPSPSATNDGTATPEAAVPMHYLALETVTEPTGLVTEFSYVPEAYFAGVAQPELLCTSGCVIANCGDPDVFWWESRLVADGRVVSGPDVATQSWLIARPQTTSLLDTDVPSSCGSQDPPQLEPGLDLDRTVTVTDPVGVETTYVFDQWDADYAFLDPASNQAYCDQNPNDLSFYPGNGDLEPDRGALLSVTSSSAGAPFEQHVYTYSLWQHSTQPYATWDQPSWVPVLVNTTTLVDGLPYHTRSAQAFPDTYGRVSSWVETIQTSADPGSFDTATSVTSYPQTPPSAFADWNLVDLPDTHLTTFQGVTTSNEVYTYGPAGDALGRLTLLQEVRQPSTAGPDLLTVFGYANTPSSTTITVTPIGGPPTQLLVGAGGVEELSVGGQTLESTAYSTSGHPVSSTDERGLTATWDWDNDGQLQGRTLSAGGIDIEASFDWSGWPDEISMTNSEGSTTSLEFDPYGGVLDADIPLDDTGNVAEFSWSHVDGSAGSPPSWTATLPGGTASVAATLDERFRPVSMTTSPAAGSATAAYTNVFDVTVGEGSGRTWDVRVAADGTVRGVNGTDGDCFQWGPAFTYSGSGAPGLSGAQVGSVLADGACTPTGQATRLVQTMVDSTGAPLGEDDTGHGGSSVVRDGDGRIDEIDFPDGSVVAVTYESGGRGRPEFIDWQGADGTSDFASLTYGTTGADSGMVKVIDTAAGSATFGYSPLGSQISVTDDEDYTASGIPLPATALVDTSTRSFVVDDQGRIESMVYGDGSEVVYTWHGSDNLDSVTFVDGSGTPHAVVLSTEWSAHGMANRTFANGMELEHSRDGHGLLIGGAITGIDVTEPDDYWEAAPVAFGAPTEVCTDGVDNNLDGWADCDDPACGPHIACVLQIELCGDGIDNDGDLDVDCDDITCDDSQSCSGLLPNRGEGARLMQDEALSVSIPRDPNGLPTSIQTTWEGQTRVEVLARDPRNRVTQHTNVGGQATWTLGYDTADNLTDLDTGGDRVDLDFAAQQWFSNLPSGNGWSSDPQTGNISTAPGITLRTGGWHRVTIVELTNAAGQSVVTHRLTHNSRGLVAIEWDEVNGWGRWYKYAPGTPLLMEELVWDPNQGQWVTFRNYVWDPQSLTIVGFYENPLVYQEEPPCPPGFEVDAYADRNELSWLPVPLAHHYAVYRDGLPVRYIEAAEPWFRDFQFIPGQDAEYEVRSVSAKGIESDVCPTQTVASTANPSLWLQWDPPDPVIADLAGYALHWCPLSAWSNTATCSNLFSVSGAELLTQESFIWESSAGYDPSIDMVIIVVAVDVAGNRSVTDTLEVYALNNGVPTPSDLASHPDSASLQVVITSPGGLRNVFAQATGGSVQGFFGVDERGPLGILASPLAQHLTGIDPTTGERRSLQPGMLISELGVRFEGTNVFAEHVMGGGPAMLLQKLSHGYQGAIRPGLDELVADIQDSGGSVASRAFLGVTAFAVEMVAMAPLGILELGNNAGYAWGAASQSAYSLSGWEKFTVGLGAVGDVMSLAAPTVRAISGARAMRASRAGTGSSQAKTAGRSGPCGCCFVAGTPVSTANGLVPIDEIEVGDLVVTRSAENGDLVHAEVLQVFETPDRPLIELEVVSGDDVERIITTPEHPFAVSKEGEFVAAAELRPGALVVGANGWLKVASGTWLQERATGYNLEIEGEHTYLVGESQAWVHNTSVGPCPCVIPATVRLRYEPGLIKAGSVMGRLHKRQFARKARQLERLSQQGLLRKASSARDPAVTKAHRQDLIKRIWEQYGKTNPEFAKAAIRRTTSGGGPGRVQMDHIWELQLGGPDAAGNLQALHWFTNWHMGTIQLRGQLRQIADGTPIRLIVEGL